jgi:hypothetical protein
MTETFTLLLRRGADPCRRSRIGAMPIQVATGSCAFAALNALVRDPGRDIDNLRRLLNTVNEFKASDKAIVMQRLTERQQLFKEIERVAREECSQRAGLHSRS